MTETSYLADFTTCPGCLRQFEEPRVLPCCRRSLCLSCLQAADIPSTRRCPRCRAQLNVDQPADLEPDLRAEALLRAQREIAQLQLRNSAGQQQQQEQQQQQQQEQQQQQQEQTVNCEFDGCWQPAAGCGASSHLRLCRQHLDAEHSRLAGRLRQLAADAAARVADASELGKTVAKLSACSEQLLSNCTELREFVGRVAAELSEKSEVQSVCFMQRVETAEECRTSVGRLASQLSASVAGGDYTEAVRLSNRLEAQLERLQQLDLGCDFQPQDVRPADLATAAAALQRIAASACGFRLEAAAAVAADSVKNQQRRRPVKAGRFSRSGV